MSDVTIARVYVFKTSCGKLPEDGNTYYSSLFFYKVL